MTNQAVCSQIAEVRFSLAGKMIATSEWQANLHNGNNSSILRTCEAAWVSQGQ